MADPYVAARARLVSILWERGYFAQYESATQALDLLDRQTFLAALELYREYHGKPADEATEPVRFCALPDVMPLRRTVCRWPMPRIAWSTTFKTALFVRAWGAWADVCGIDPYQAAAVLSANVISEQGRIDGRGRTLAWSELPCGATQQTQLKQLYDKADDTDDAMLLLTMMHELGHGLGLDHGPYGALMAPELNTSILGPQSWDIGQVVGRYGPAKPKLPPPEPSAVTIILRGNIESIDIPGYRVSKLA